MSERATGQEAAWYDITIAGKRFNVASRHGEAHIRAVERLLGDTYDEVNARVKGQSALNVALLTALNLADQLLAIQSGQEGASAEWGERMETMLVRLSSALGPEENGTP